jgi:hypothetical protein
MAQRPIALVKRIGHHRNLGVPTRTAGPAGSTSSRGCSAMRLTARRADPASRGGLCDFAGWQSSNGWRRAVDARGGQSNGQVWREHGPSAKELAHETILSCGEPVTYSRGPFTDAHNIPEMPKSLKVPAIMPPEEGFCGEQADHCIHPLRMPEAPEAPSHRLLDRRESVAAFGRIAAGADGVGVPRQPSAGAAVFRT